MGVAEDAEAHLQEEDLLFEGEASQAKVQRGANKYFCRAASVIVLLVAAVLVGMPAKLGIGGRGDEAPLVCGRTGHCPLWGLFFDPEVHQLVAENLVRAASPSLSGSDLPMVLGLVEGSFRNISQALSTNAPKVAQELHVLKINATIKEYMAEAMDLVTDPRVQGFGRHVAAAVRASPMNFKDEEDLKQHIAKNLWHQLDEIQQFQLEEVSWRIHAIWSLGKGAQWEMTLDVEAMGWQEAVGSTKAPAAEPLAAAGIGTSLAAVVGGALAEGRTLLDLMLMCIRSKGSSWSTDLYGAVEAFSGPLNAPCEPELSAGGSVDSGRLLVCPLKFGMLGVDALRYASTLRRHPGRTAGCKRLGRCPLRGLFMDHDVHKMVAESLVGLGVPLQGSTSMDEVVSIVGESFRNVDTVIQKRSPLLGAELELLPLSDSLRAQLLQAVKLTYNPQVQSLGRDVARALAAGRPYESPESLRRGLEADLQQRLGSVQKLQEELVPAALRKLWHYGEDKQWELALAVANAEAYGGGARDSAAFRSASARDAVIVDGVLAEGRALLDVMLMCSKSKVSSKRVTLGKAEEVFAGPLATPCDTEGMAGSAGFRSAVLCPLKFGLLGLDALRSSARQPQVADGAVPSSTRGQLEQQPCTALKACPLRDIFFDRSVQERAVADIIGAAADPSMLLGRSNIPLVRHAVISAFRNVSESFHQSAPAVEADLGHVLVNHTVKQYIFEALQLMVHIHVQEIGRHIARSLRVGGDFASPEELKAEVLRNLWRSFPEIQRLQATVSRYAVRHIWKAASAPQLELTYELEAQERRHRQPTSITSPSLPLEEAVAQAAWQEGRALLDLALAFVHSGLRGEVGRLAPPPPVHCDPDVKIGREVGFQSAMVCPLRFGIIGMDVLRFTDSIFTWTHLDQRSCKDRGMCPLARFFFDDYVHAAATADILRIAGSMVHSKKVEQVVERVFRNISVHVHLYAPGVAENLNAVQAGEAEKERFASAMQLVSDPRVQAFGREIAAAVRAASGFSGRADLQAHVISLLGSRRIQAMRNYSLSRVDSQVREIWRMGEDEQWTMTTDPEMVSSLKAPPSGLAVPTLGDPSAEAVALEGAALIEGRVLVDLLLMRIRALHSSLSTSLFGAMDVFSPALSTPCPLELPVSGDSLTSSLICPLKFGALGLDALRYAATSLATMEPTSLEQR